MWCHGHHCYQNLVFIYVWMFLFFMEGIGGWKGHWGSLQWSSQIQEEEEKEEENGRGGCIWGSGKKNKHQAVKLISQKYKTVLCICTYSHQMNVGISPVLVMSLHLYDCRRWAQRPWSIQYPNPKSFLCWPPKSRIPAYPPLRVGFKSSDAGKKSQRGNKCSKSIVIIMVLNTTFLFSLFLF